MGFLRYKEYIDVPQEWVSFSMSNYISTGSNFTKVNVSGSVIFYNVFSMFIINMNKSKTAQIVVLMF